jgi:cytochrome P450
LYTPFHAGPRDCMGKQLALISGKIIFSQLLLNYKIELSNPDYELKMTQRFMFEPEEDIYCKMTPAI